MTERKSPSLHAQAVRTTRTALSARCGLKLAIAALSVASTACFAQSRAADKVVLFQTYQEVKRILGQPLAEGPPSECQRPQRFHLMLYKRPDALLQLVFDARYRLKSIRLVATTKPPKQARTLQWPGLDTRFAKLRPYAEVEEAFPVFYQDQTFGSGTGGFGRDDVRYWESQPPEADSRGTRVFRGHLTFSRLPRPMPIEGEAPFVELGVLYGTTHRDRYEVDRYVGSGDKYSWDLFGEVLSWRHRAIPNAFMWVASGPLLSDPECNPILIDFTDLNDSLLRMDIGDARARKLVP